MDGVRYAPQLKNKRLNFSRLFFVLRIFLITLLT